MEKEQNQTDALSMNGEVNNHPPDAKKAKMKVKQVVLPIEETFTQQLPKNRISTYMEQEDHQTFSELLNGTENWLYEEGADQDKQTHINKLEEIHKLGKPVQNRYQESIRIPKMFEKLSAKIQSYMNIMEEYKNGIDSYCHINTMDMDEVRVCVEDTQVWMTNKGFSEQRTPDQEPAIHSTQIKEKLLALKNICEEIVSKPTPSIDSPIDENIQPERPHNKKSPEDVTMEY